MSIRSLIVDDEPLARIRVSDLLGTMPDFEIVGEAENGIDAVSKIRSLKPDLVFLDIQMPQLDGLGVITNIGLEHMPYIIFITAYDNYLLQAFEVHALDYLLKPFDPERFRNTLEHAMKVLHLVKGRETVTEELMHLLQEVQSTPRHLRKFAVKSGERLYFVDAAEIDWIESAGNYVILHVREEKHLLRMTMTQCAAHVDQDQFVRIHRSTYVNIDRIKEIRQRDQGDHLVLLHNGVKLIMSRTYRHNLHAMFQ